MKYHNVRDKNGRFSPKNGMKPLEGKTITAKRTKTAAATHILNAFLLDASGSMDGKSLATVEGFNTILTNARKDVLPSTELLAFFGSAGTYRLFDKVTTMTLSGKIGYDNEGKLGYAPILCSTALYDSTYDLIRDTETKLASMTGKVNVILTIFTDGEENDSRRVSLEMLKSLIETKQKAGWVITFIGAGEEWMVKKVSGAMGIFASNTTAYNNTSQGTRDVMSKMSASRTTYTQSASVGAATTDGFFSND